MWDIVNVIATGLIVAFAIAITHRVVAGRRLRQARPKQARGQTSPSGQ